MLCSFGFVDDVFFAYNQPHNGNGSRVFTQSSSYRQQQTVSGVNNCLLQEVFFQIYHCCLGYALLDYTCKKST